MGPVELLFPSFQTGQSFLGLLMSLSDILLTGLPFFLGNGNLAKIANIASILKCFVSRNDEGTKKQPLTTLLNWSVSRSYEFSHYCKSDQQDPGSVPGL